MLPRRSGDRELFDSRILSGSLAFTLVNCLAGAAVTTGTYRVSLADFQICWERWTSKGEHTFLLFARWDLQILPFSFLFFALRMALSCSHTQKTPHGMPWRPCHCLCQVWGSKRENSPGDIVVSVRSLSLVPEVLEKRSAQGSAISLLVFAFGGPIFSG